MNTSQGLYHCPCLCITYCRFPTNVLSLTCVCLAVDCQTAIKQSIGHIGRNHVRAGFIQTAGQQNHRERPLPCCSLHCQDPGCTACYCSLVDNSWEISYLVVQMVLSNNSGSRLAIGSWGIGREALGCATEALPSIYLVVPWPPGTQGQFSMVLIVLLKNKLKNIL